MKRSQVLAELVERAYFLIQIPLDPGFNEFSEDEAEDAQAWLNDARKSGALEPLMNARAAALALRIKVEPDHD